MTYEFSDSSPGGQARPFFSNVGAKLRHSRQFLTIAGQLRQLFHDAYAVMPQAVSLQLLQTAALRHLFRVFALAQGAYLVVAVALLYPLVASLGDEEWLWGAVIVWCILLCGFGLAVYAPGRRWAVSRGLRVAARASGMMVGVFWGVVLSWVLPELGGVGQSSMVVATLLLTDMAILLIPVGFAPLFYAGAMNGVLLWRFGMMLQESGNPFYGACALGVVSNLIFVLLASSAVRVLLVGFQVNREYLHQRDRILALLLGGPDDTRGDWLWETDAEGRLCNVSSGLARIMKKSAASLDGASFVGMLARSGSQWAAGGDASSEFPAGAEDFYYDSAIERLKECLERRIFFRDLVICVNMTKSGANSQRYWSLSGRPVFKDQVFQGYGGVGTDVTDAHHAQKAALFQARHDTLTGLPNRAAFFDDMASYLVRNEQEGKRFALLNLDLDGFKQINDRYGHVAGDEVLKIVATRLCKALGEGERLYRLGGDEFVVLEKGATPRTAAATARRLIEALEMQPVALRDGIHCLLGLSVGVVMAEGAQKPVEQLLASADLALYESKKHGGSGYRFFQPGLESLVRRDRQLVRDLAAALENGGVALTYQPFFDMQSQALLGYEALVSWTHPEYGRVTADQLIHIAEEAGLIQDLGLYVLREAVTFAKTWPDSLLLSVNVSVAQLNSEPHRKEWVRVFEESGLPAHRLQLEVTETVFMERSPAIYAKLNLLRERGVSIVLDDFGKGYSCLSYLNFFPFSKIKLDRLFVSEMLYNPRATAIVRAVIGLAVDLGVAVTAEGVETQEQYDYLVRLGCTEVQGYYFSRPIGPMEVNRMLREKRLLPAA